jgi:type IV secretory pathway protease TraF
MMALGTLHPQEAVFQPAAFEVIGKFLFHMQGQGLALRGHHIPKRRVIRQFYVLGDNKRSSQDSRAFGGIEPEWILGKVSLVLLSFDQQWKWREQRLLKIVQ